MLYAFGGTPTHDGWPYMDSYGLYPYFASGWSASNGPINNADGRADCVCKLHSHCVQSETQYATILSPSVKLFPDRLFPERWHRPQRRRSAQIIINNSPTSDRYSLFRVCVFRFVSYGLLRNSNDGRTRPFHCCETSETVLADNTSYDRFT